jgi:hypothetical protein
VTDVQVGTAVIAYIEPHEGQSQAFNRWYERDHMYAAATAGPGAFAGARWVATRECKAMRPPSATWFGDPARGSYMTTVWLLDDTQDEWDGWVARQMEQLRVDPDRMFAGRDHIFTAVYRFDCEVRGPDGVSSATALDHPFAGLVAMALPAGSAGGVAHSLIGPELPTAAVFTPERVILAEAQPPPFDLVLGFTAGDPIAAWRTRIAPVLSGLTEVGFAGPFVRTIPGTDAFTDDL